MSRYSHEHPEEFTPSGGFIDERDDDKVHASQAARDAHYADYGSCDYHRYLDKYAAELVLKGVVNAFTRTLSEALDGNDSL